VAVTLFNMATEVADSFHIVISNEVTYDRTSALRLTDT
jgi:hypothetical protein